MLYQFKKHKILTGLFACSLVLGGVQGANLYAVKAGQELKATDTDVDVDSSEVANYFSKAGKSAGKVSIMVLEPKLYLGPERTEKVSNILLEDREQQDAEMKAYIEYIQEHPEADEDYNPNSEDALAREEAWKKSRKALDQKIDAVYEYEGVPSFRWAGDVDEFDAMFDENITRADIPQQKHSNLELPLNDKKVLSELLSRKDQMHETHLNVQTEQLEDNEIVLSEKAAQLLNVTVGDTVNLQWLDRDLVVKEIAQSPDKADIPAMDKYATVFNDMIDVPMVFISDALSTAIDYAANGMSKYYKEFGPNDPIPGSEQEKTLNELTAVKIDRREYREAEKRLVYRTFETREEAEEFLNQLETYVKAIYEHQEDIEKQGFIIDWGKSVYIPRAK